MPELSERKLAVQLELETNRNTINRVKREALILSVLMIISPNNIPKKAEKRSDVISYLSYTNINGKIACSLLILLLYVAECGLSITKYSKKTDKNIFN